MRAAELTGDRTVSGSVRYFGGAPDFGDGDEVRRVYTREYNVWRVLSPPPQDMPPRLPPVLAASRGTEG